jgi:hypothetical protein
MDSSTLTMIFVGALVVIGLIAGVTTLALGGKSKK